MSLKKGLQKHGERVRAGIKKEHKQLHMLDSFILKHREEISPEQWKNRCEAVNVIKEKKCGEIKGRACADGRAQCDFISKEDTVSPTSSTDAALLTEVIEQKHCRKVITLDTPNDFIQSKVEDSNERIILVVRSLLA